MSGGSSGSRARRKGGRDQSASKGNRCELFLLCMHACFCVLVKMYTSVCVIKVVLVWAAVCVLLSV